MISFCVCSSLSPSITCWTLPPMSQHCLNKIVDPERFARLYQRIDLYVNGILHPFQSNADREDAAYNSTASPHAEVLHLLCVSPTFALRATRDSSWRRHNNITKVTRITVRDAARKSSDVNFRDEGVRSWEITVLRLSCLFGNLYLSSLCQHHAEELGRVSRWYISCN